MRVGGARARRDVQRRRPLVVAQLGGRAGAQQQQQQLGLLPHGGHVHRSHRHALAAVVGVGAAREQPLRLGRVVLRHLGLGIAFAFAFGFGLGLGIGFGFGFGFGLGLGLGLGFGLGFRLGSG